MYQIVGLYIAQDIQAASKAIFCGDVNLGGMSLFFFKYGCIYGIMIATEWIKDMVLDFRFVQSIYIYKDQTCCNVQCLSGVRFFA